MDNNKLTDNQPTPEKNRNISRKRYLWVIGIFILLGVTGGYLYYYFIGCNNGCTIQSNPYLSMIWGGAMGYLLPDLVLKPRK